MTVAAYLAGQATMLDGQIQSSYGDSGHFDAVREASGLLMGLALHLGRAVGADPADLTGH